MLPHHGQGANTSIEDAFALAGLLAERDSADLGAAFARYQRLRRGRTRTIQRSSWVTSGQLHLHDGPAARDARVARFPEDFGWIHAYDVQQALAAGQLSPI